jgi:outer membrane protein insertion porin family
MNTVVFFFLTLTGGFLRKAYWLLGFFFVSTLFSQVQRIQLNSITVEGNTFSDATTIRVHSGLVAGEMITMEDVQQSLRNLWALRLYEDLEILVKNQTVETIDLIIKVKEYPRLNKVIMDGHDELDKDDIDKELKFYRGMVISPAALYKGKRRIEQYYKSEGYYLATATLDTVYAAPGKVDVELTITEGEEVQVESITFHGNTQAEDDDPWYISMFSVFDSDDGKLNFEDDVLRDTFEEIKEDRWWRSADFSEANYETDKGLLIKFYKDNGFRDAEILRDSISYSEDGSDMYIDIWLYEGIRYYFGNFSFEGNTTFDDPTLKDALGLKYGDPYNLSQFELALRQNLQNVYYNEGYLFARIQPIETPIAKDTVDIRFEINEGNVVRIRELLIKGNTKTDDRVIRREFKLFPGDKFNNALLERSAREVWVLNYFGNVIPDVKLIENNDEEIDLEVTVEEKSTDTANMSAGYSQRDGFIGNLGLAFNNFSSRHPLSGGGGQKLTVDFQFGLITQSLSFSFIEPWLYDKPIRAGFSVYYSRFGSLEFYRYQQRRYGGRLFIGKRFKWPDNFWRGDWSLIYSDIKLEYSDDVQLQNFSSFYVGDEGDPTDFKSIGVLQVFTRDSRNRPEFPTQGSVLSLSNDIRLGPNSENDVNYEKYIKNEASLEWFVPAVFGSVFYNRTKAGIINELGDYSFVSRPENFYLGGNGLGIAEALRGYDDGVVGRRDNLQLAYGGRALFLSSFEWRFQIAPNPTIYGLLFAEAGNVWRSPYEFDLGTLSRSAGLGVRLFMPMIGLIGVDFGYGFDNYNALGQKEGKWQIHFQFGKF